MAARRQQQQDRARRFAVALAAFCRYQEALPVAAVAENPDCLRQASALLQLLEAVNPSGTTCNKAGRRQLHDRDMAKSALLDFVMRHPDGMLHQAALVEELARRFEAAGLTVPGDTWLKQTVRAFQGEVSAFETDAADIFRASPALQAAFETESRFIAFRRAKQRIEDIWRKTESVRGRYSTPSAFLESLANADVSHAIEDGQFAPIRAFANQYDQCKDETFPTEDFENGTQS